MKETQIPSTAEQSETDPLPNRHEVYYQVTLAGLEQVNDWLSGKKEPPSVVDGEVLLEMFWFDDDRKLQLNVRRENESCRLEGTLFNDQWDVLDNRVFNQMDGPLEVSYLHDTYAINIIGA